MKKILMLLVAVSVVCAVGSSDAAAKKKFKPKAKPQPKAWLPYAELVAKMDTDADGQISKDEFAALGKTEEIKARKAAFFTKIDANANGFLDEEEVPKVEDEPVAALHRAHAQYDTNADNKLSKQECASCWLAKQFGKFDKNKDQFLTADELPTPKGKK
jgi:Ca2+-binding EF-hand superfamily protein